MSEEYNFALQGAGIAIVACASALGAGFSFWIAHAKRHGGKNLEWLAALLVLLKGLGAGVAISTALIHLIGEASDSFEEVGWSGGEDQYDAWPYVFAQVGILMMASGEYFARRQKSTHETSCEGQIENDESQAIGSAERNNAEALMDVDHGHGHGHGQTHTGGHVIEVSKSKNTDSFVSSKELSSKRTAAFMMEVSVITHSIIIGLDLGLQNEENWKTLVIAIVFHQFFEGIALAQVIAEAQYDKLLRALLALLAFVLTTPTGIAIGMIVIAATNSDQEPSQLTLTIGILNSLCGGFLLYIGMINLLNNWFVQNENFLRAKPSYYTLGWVGVTLGMAAMAVIGIWA